MHLCFRRLRGPCPELGPGWLQDGDGRRAGLELVLLWLRVQLWWR